MGKRKLDAVKMNPKRLFTIDPDREKTVVDRKPKRKVAITVGYCGFGYQGLQRNPGAKTIEDELESALFKSGRIREDLVGEFVKVGWQRCSRTDKGVHALANVVALKMNLSPGEEKEDLLDQMNANSPEGIIFYDFTRVVGAFNARNNVDSRVYEYLLPLDIIAPIPQGKGYGERPDLVPASIDDIDTSTLLQPVQDILQVMKGAHKFHNFCPRKSSGDKSAIRYMLDLQAKEIVIEGQTWISVVIHGQSFMLNQIRCMMTFLIMCMRHHLDDYAALFQLLVSDEHYHIPTAPGFSLILHECKFDHYNQNKGTVHGPIKVDHIKDKMDTFLHQVLYPRIVSHQQEEVEDNFSSWVGKVGPKLNDLMRSLGVEVDEAAPKYVKYVPEQEEGDVEVPVPSEPTS